LEIKIGKVAKELREKLGISQKEAAESLGVTNVYLSNIENDKASPSSALLDKYRELWGIDLYVVAWCRYGDISKLPPEVQNTAAKLSKLWNRQLEQLAARK
jgi:transcriptional regulator with XRE-family HTH domain